MKVAIIGGGASGVLAALKIKVNRPEIDVTIYEKNNKLLKKVASDTSPKQIITTGKVEINTQSDDIKTVTAP